MRYLWEFLKAIFGQGWSWLWNLVAVLLGYGIAQDYPAARDSINNLFGHSVMPVQLQWWMIVLPFLVVVISRLAHKEARRVMGAGRLFFDDPYVHRQIPLTKTITYDTGAQARIPSGKTVDIAKINVRNEPFDMAQGIAVADSFATIEFYDPELRRSVLQYDYPRWQQNEKPEPADKRIHIRDEWNRRNLLPTGDKNTLNFLLKYITDDCAYGFTAGSQNQPDWIDERLKLQPGEYVAKLVVSGSGLRSPAVKWIQVSVGGVGKSIEVHHSRPLDTSWWRF